MTNGKSKVRRGVKTVGVLMLLGAATWIVFQTNAVSFAAVPRLGDEFEAIGSETGEFGLPRRVRHTPTGIVLVLIPSGGFTMGSPESELKRDGDEVQRSAAIESPFYLGETEVTAAQWRQIMGTVPRDAVPSDNRELPISGVTWHKAKEFVRRMNALGSPGWRLPSEAEWEYACRAGTTTAFSFGHNITPQQVNYDGLRPYAGAEAGLRRDWPVSVRSLPRNPWGLYEMHGNVFEWCEDLYVVHPERGIAAKDVPGASRVLRGGAWNSKGKQVRSAYRDGYPPESSGTKYGFRIAKSIR
ncbi:MAG: formylglycine-generating enzyme family protein [Planctomycetes bacterium]|nr:formylglycine-generating enzyme family protein [Planctomycetota bacterium]